MKQQLHKFPSYEKNKVLLLPILWLLFNLHSAVSIFDDTQTIIIRDDKTFVTDSFIVRKNEKFSKTFSTINR